MIVWILTQGETSESGDVIGVFASHESARSWAESQEHYCAWGEWGGDHGYSLRKDEGCAWQFIEGRDVHP